MVHTHSSYYIIPGPPTPPSGLTVNTSSALSSLLSWNTSHGENITYQLKVLQAAGSVSGGVVVVNVSTTSHLYHVPQAERCTEHEFVVRAVNPAGASNYSDPVMAFIPDGEFILYNSTIHHPRIEEWELHVVLLIVVLKFS